MNSTTEMTSRPIIPNNIANGPRKVPASPPADPIVSATVSMTRWVSSRPACHATSEITSAPRMRMSMTKTVTTVATIALGPSFNASTTSSGRPPNPAWIAVASIIATTIAKEIPASGATRPFWNQLAVRFGVVAESSTPHTHSISISRPLANQVYTP